MLRYFAQPLNTARLHWHAGIQAACHSLCNHRLPLFRQQLNQPLLPFDSAAEYQESRAEAEAEAATIVQKYEVTRTVKKNRKRIESFPNHLPRVEKIVTANEQLRTCPNHGERQLLGYDTTETLVCNSAELYVLVRKYQHDPVRHEVVSESTTAETLEQRFIGVLPDEKLAIAARIASKRRSRLKVRPAKRRPKAATTATRVSAPA